MAEIKFTREEKQALLARIQTYVSEEFDQDIGLVAAQTMLDFMDGELGNFFYNRGLYDAQAAISKRLDEVSEAIYALEKPTDFRA
jgi:uncharacterized protein (DUF2164 family)